jgi:hypothetical protein
MISKSLFGLGMGLIFILLAACSAFDPQFERRFGEHYRGMLKSEHGLNDPKEIGEWALGQSSGVSMRRATYALLEIARTEDEANAKIAILYYLKIYNQLRDGWPRELSTNESVEGIQRPSRVQSEYERGVMQHMKMECSNVAARVPSRKFIQDAVNQMKK